MRRAALTVAASLFAVLACQDLSTTPANSDLKPSDLGTYSGDNPPPPPIDSGAVGVADSPTSEATEASFNVTYMFNKVENSGWLKFKKDQFDTQVDIDNSAAVKMNGGVFSGKGTIQIIGSDRVLVINLAQVSYGESSFGECTVGTPTATTDGASRGCYSVQISGAKLVMNDGTTHDASLYLRAGPKKECISREGPCIITPES